ncbi:MAG: hypothetical protein QNJ91_17520, partial [Gammaproteobacteria bacterium]|nr:hypothetical protein [Gammaproteobacteria bacterium]
PSLRGALFFAFFLLGKQKKEGRARSAERIQNKPRASARTTPSLPSFTPNRHNEKKQSPRVRAAVRIKDNFRRVSANHM